MGCSKQVWYGCKMRKLEHVINVEGGGEGLTSSPKALRHHV